MSLRCSRCDLLALKTKSVTRTSSALARAAEAISTSVGPMEVLAANSAGKVVAAVGALFAHFDEDGDNKLSFDEIHAMVQRLWERWGNGAGGPAETVTMVDEILCQFAPAGSSSLSHRCLASSPRSICAVRSIMLHLGVLLMVGVLPRVDDDWHAAVVSWNLSLRLL